MEVLKMSTYYEIQETEGGYIIRIQGGPNKQFAREVMETMEYPNVRWSPKDTGWFVSDKMYDEFETYKDMFMKIVSKYYTIGS